MAKYVVDSASLTPIADETRTIDGVTSGLSLEAIASKLNSANSEIGSQVNLISQIKELLDGKASGGGGNFVTGTFTIGDTDVEEITVNHNLGIVPNFVFVMQDDLDENKSVGFKFAMMAQHATPDRYPFDGTTIPAYRYHVARIHSSSAYNFKHYFSNVKSIDGTGLYYGILELTSDAVKFGDANKAAFFSAGKTFNWICAVIATTNAEI